MPFNEVKKDYFIMWDEIKILAVCQPCHCPQMPCFLASNNKWTTTATQNSASSKGVGSKPATVAWQQEQQQSHGDGAEQQISSKQTRGSRDGGRDEGELLLELACHRENSWGLGIRRQWPAGPDSGNVVTRARRVDRCIPVWCLVPVWLQS